MHRVAPRVIYGLGILLGVLLIGRVPALYAAQDAPPKSTLVSLGAVSGGPKAQVMVPLFLTPVPADRQVGSFSATIEFTNKGITFLKAEKSFLLDGVNGSVKAESEKDPSDPAKSIIHLEVSTSGEPRKALRDGLTLSLVFKIEPDATPGIVPLDFKNVAAGNLETPPKPITPVISKKGTIEVLKPEAVPYVGCFFFSH